MKGKIEMLVNRVEVSIVLVPLVKFKNRAGLGGKDYQVDILPRVSQFRSVPQGVRIINIITIDLVFYRLPLFYSSEEMMDRKVFIFTYFFFKDCNHILTTN